MPALDFRAPRTLGNSPRTGLPVIQFGSSSLYEHNGRTYTTLESAFEDRPIPAPFPASSIDVVESVPAQAPCIGDDADDAALQARLWMHHYDHALPWDTRSFWEYTSHVN